jgi:hypothetical protein
MSIVIVGLIGDKGFARAGENAKKNRYLRAGKARSAPFSRRPFTLPPRPFS